MTYLWVREQSQSTLVARAMPRKKKAAPTPAASAPTKKPGRTPNAGTIWQPQQEEQHEYREVIKTYRIAVQKAQPMEVYHELYHLLQHAYGYQSRKERKESKGKECYRGYRCINAECFHVLTLGNWVNVPRLSYPAIDRPTEEPQV